MGRTVGDACGPGKGVYSKIHPLRGVGVAVQCGGRLHREERWKVSPCLPTKGGGDIFIPRVKRDLNTESINNSSSEALNLMIHINKHKSRDVVMIIHNLKMIKLQFFML